MVRDLVETVKSPSFLSLPDVWSTSRMLHDCWRGKSGLCRCQSDTGSVTMPCDDSWMSLPHFKYNSSSYKLRRGTAGKTSHSTRGGGDPAVQFSRIRGSAKRQTHRSKSPMRHCPTSLKRMRCHVWEETLVFFRYLVSRESSARQSVLLRSRFVSHVGWSGTSDACCIRTQRSKLRSAQLLL